MKYLLLAVLLTLANLAQSATIVITEGPSSSVSGTFVDLGQTILDTTTNLEWLNFSNLNGGTNERMTTGYSLISSLAYYDDYGFRIATKPEISNLFGIVFPSANGNITSFPEGDGTSDLVQSRNSWMFGFGTDANPNDPNTTFGTVSGGTTFTITGGVLSSLGMYRDENNNIQIAGIVFDIDTLTSEIYGTSYMTNRNLSGDTAYGDLGAFMVRDYSVVPIPAAVWLFTSGLLGLVAVARRKAS